MAQARIPEEIIQSILNHHDIVEVVNKYVHLTKRGKNFIGLCPFHSEKTPSFTVSQDKQIFHCFGCGNGGNAIKFMMEMDGLSFPEVVRLLGEEANIDYRWEEMPQEESESHKERKLILRAHEWSSKWFHHVLMGTANGSEAIAYLRTRGFTDQMIDHFQIGYAPPMRDSLMQFLRKREFPLPLLEQGGLIRSGEKGDSDLFRNRVMFPIHDSRGNVIAFSGRSLGDAQPKYLNTPETHIFTKSDALYHIHQAKTAMRQSRVAILFEGFADVIKAWGAGIHNGVATMGTALTDQHIVLLKRYVKEVIVCYDGDDAGQAATLKSLALLMKAGLSAKAAILPDGQDPDDYIEKHGGLTFVREVIETAVVPTRYRLIISRRKFPIHTSEGKLAYMNEAIRLVARVDSPAERELYLRELSSELGVTFEAMKQDCFEMRQEFEKKRRIGDNNEKSWNNVWNDRTPVKTTTTSLRPAYVNAEKQLLSHMMHSREVTLYVQERLEDRFNVDKHAALAAYLYAFFARFTEPNISQFLSTLDNNELESEASAISLLHHSEVIHQQVIDDYLKEIMKYPTMQLFIHTKKLLLEAERSGRSEEATRLGLEVMDLDRQLRSKT